MTEQVPVSWLKPKNDFVFKLLFGSEDETSKELLLAFLNDVLDVPEGQSLAKLEILNPTLNKESILDKLAILDVRARAVGYGYVNVEIQLSNQKNIHKRSLYYASKLYEEQLNEGEKYKKLTKVIAINLMDFQFFPSAAYCSCYGLREDHTLEAYPDDLMKLHFIEMPKFVYLDQNRLIDKNDRLAKWLRFLTNMDDARWEEMAKQEPMIGKAIEKLRLASLDPETRMQYEAREKALKDIASIREDTLEDVAVKMLREGLDISLIMRMTGLSEEEVKKLAAELNN